MIYTEDFNKYRTNPRGYPLVILVGNFGMLAMLFLTTSIPLENPIFLLFLILIGLLVLNAYFGIYIKSNNREIIKTLDFLRKKSMPYADIREVYFHPSWRFGNSARTLTIVSHENNQKKILELVSNSFFSGVTIQAIAREIRRHAPDAVFDRSSEELLNTKEVKDSTLDSFGLSLIILLAIALAIFFS